MNDGSCDRKPDLINAIAQNLGVPTWFVLLSIHEVKKEGASPSEAILQLAQYARLIFRFQPNRRFVIASYIIGVKIYLVVFDRSGALTTQGFNVHRDPETFLRIVVGLLFLDRTHLGYDPTIVLDAEGRRGHLFFKGMKYIIRDVVYVEGVIRGRGTVCYRVHPEGGDPFQDDEYIVKDSWVNKARAESEANILRHLNQKGVTGVPYLVDDEAVSFGGETDTTARFRFSLSNAGPELRDHHRILMKPFGKRLENFRSLPEFMQVMRDVANSKHRF